MNILQRFWWVKKNTTAGGKSVNMRPLEVKYPTDSGSSVTFCPFSIHQQEGNQLTWNNTQEDLKSGI